MKKNSNLVIQIPIDVPSEDVKTRLDKKNEDLKMLLASMQKRLNKSLHPFQNKIIERVINNSKTYGNNYQIGIRKSNA